MRKKYTSSLVILVIATVIITLIAAWMKLTHQKNADDALTVSLTFHIITVMLLWFGFYLIIKQRKLTFSFFLNL